MNRVLLVFLCVVSSAVVSAQEIEFGYDKSKNGASLNSGEINYVFGKYVVFAGAQEIKSVQSQDDDYRLLIQTSQDGKVKKVLNSKDSLLATVFLTGEHANNILLADGRMLRFKKVSNTEWAYTDGGKEVVTYTYKKTDGRKRVIVNLLDPSYNVNAVQIICLEHASKKLKGNPAAGAVIASATLALILALMTQAS